MSRLGLRLTPHGRLSLEDQDDGPEIDAAASIRLIDAFARGTGYGLVWLGAAEAGQALPPLFVWWRDFAALYVGSLCLHASSSEAEERVKLPSIPAPAAAELSSLVLTAPIMAGAEYLTEDVLLALWNEMEQAFAASLAAAKVGLQAFLTSLNRAWNLVGSGAFQFSGKPPRSRPALRLHGDVHNPPVRAGEGTARPPRPSAARIRRNG